MVIPFSVNGQRVVIPGIYDTLRVASSLPAPVAAGRSILILGEGLEGVPGSLLDLKLNYFTDFQSVKEYYTSGPIVDAARMAFSPQSNFGGSVNRLYIWKTNQTTNASKILGPTGFGSLGASVYGEQGNYIKSQITGLSEVLPTKTLLYVPAPAATTLKVGVDGTVSSISVGAPNLGTGAGMPTSVATLLDGITGLNASATAKAALLGATDITLTATGDVLNLSGSTAFATALSSGDIVVIPETSHLAGASKQNAGVYVVQSWSASAGSIKQIRRWVLGVEVAVATAFDLTAVIGAVVADIGGFSPITIEVVGTTPVGTAASLEISAASGAISGASHLVDWDSSHVNVSDQNAALGSISASVNGTALTVSLTNAFWSVKPVAGNVVMIDKNSLIAGATKQNVGTWVVTAGSQQSATMLSVSGLTPAAVSAIPMNGSTDDVMFMSATASTTIATKKYSSAAEAQVVVNATQIRTGAMFPTTPIGGNVYLEVGYSDGVASVCSLSIDAFRKMTIAPTGGTSLVINLNKYNTLQQLVDFLNTKTGIFAQVPNNLWKSLPTSVLDAVSCHILGAFSAASAPGKIKGDYYSFKKFLDDNFGMLSFAPGLMTLKAGLPDVEASASFLTGAAVGATSNSDIAEGLDAGLKVDVRNVVPLFSRDAIDDIQDGNTDESSDYDIDSINALVQSHVATARGVKMKKERVGVLSIHDSFENSKNAVSSIGYEYCQMTFQMIRAVDGLGAINWMLPYMSAMAVAAGRSQASLATSMLRKSFALNDVKHIGKLSLYSDTLVVDFDVEDNGMLEDAISAGLLVFKPVQGVGTRMESPDQSTKSSDNSPTAWYDERINVSFISDEVRSTIRSVLDPYIGLNQLDASTAVIKESLSKAGNSFVQSGSLLAFTVDKVVKEGTGYRAYVRFTPVEALEFIAVNELVERSAV